MLVMSENTVPAPIGGEKSQVDLLQLVGRFAAVIFLLVLVIGLSILEPGFRTEKNFYNVLRQISIPGIVAVGMTFVILTAGIDLSVGSIIAFAGVVAATTAKGTRDYTAPMDDGGLRVLYAFLAAITVGVIAGAIQGFAIAKLRVPAFVVTLGGLTIWRGATRLWTDSQPVNQLSSDFTFWGKGFLGPVPLPVVAFFLFVAVGYIVLKFTTFGRWIYALGGNAEAARLSGLNTTMLTISVYTIVGFCAGIAGFLLTARLGAAEQVAGLGYELTIIAMVVIGGTSLFGGAGTVIGTMVGALLIGVMNNGLVILQVDPAWQPIVTGFIVILAVFFDQFVKRRRRGG